MVKSEIVGMKDLERAFKRLGKVPQTVATKSARAGGRIALKTAKQLAPEDSGELKRGIILKREKRKIQGKAVYDVMMDPAKNDIFVKEHNAGKHHSKVRNGGKTRVGDKVRSYYPASMEYGFMTVDGGYVPGYNYLRRSIDDNKGEIEKTVLETAGKEVDKALRKR